MYTINDTIVAIATPPGEGAIGIIRLSGQDAITIANKIFKGKDLEKQESHTIHFGRIIDPRNTSSPRPNGSAGRASGRPAGVIDEVVISLYKGTKSYTGENTVEISCHGSPYVLQQVLQLCLNNGAVMAKPGEFTQRAFLNGKLDLTQAEAVADLIASESGAAHQSAMHNLRGGFSSELHQMREQLITFSALIELELDFSQEDVEFADRTKLYELLDGAITKISQLVQSFHLGNAIKNGVRVAIIGKPNAGKSTLLNSLLNEERAIVSEIAGTTRDTIEETININGILFRFIDTAGIREHSTDVIEQIGIERSRRKAEEADIILYVSDITEDNNQQIEEAENWLEGMNKPYLYILNKIDDLPEPFIQVVRNVHFLSAKKGTGVAELKQELYDKILAGKIKQEGTIITNARHYAELQLVLASLHDIKAGMDTNISGDLLALDIRNCLYHLGSITGEVQQDRDILGAIFGKFCIGK